MAWTIFFSGGEGFILKFLILSRAFSHLSLVKEDFKKNNDKIILVAWGIGILLLVPDSEGVKGSQGMGILGLCLLVTAINLEQFP